MGAFTSLPAPFSPPPPGRCVAQFCFFVSTVVSLAANLQCVASTTCVSVWGSSLALRGPDGSVLKAVENMFAERRRIFSLFASGVVAGAALPPLRQNVHGQ